MKVFVAVVVLQLSEEGRLELDDPITNLLAPSVVGRFTDSEAITVRMLLNHTSGIPEWSTEEVDKGIAQAPLKIWTVDEFLSIAAARPVLSQPGQGWVYSNTNYNLLGLIVEEITGEPWRVAVRNRVVEPLGLSGTTLPEPGDAAIPDPAMHGYVFLTPEPVDLTNLDPSMADAAGGGALVTTAPDLARFLHGLLRGQLFNESSTLSMMSAFVEASQPDGLVGYGLGLQRYQVGDTEMIGAVGGTAGYIALTGYFPEADATIALAINGWPTGDPTPIIFAVLDVLGSR
jgi:D-alanyl-D-alanine carboxypeptidase